MDPASAIGVAAAVVQFVDLGKRLVSRAHQIYVSPASRTKQESELLLSVSELRELAGQAKDAFHRYPEVQSDRSLAKIFYDVDMAALEFDAILKGLQTRFTEKRGSKGNNLKGAFRMGFDSIRTEQDVRAALYSLDRIQRRACSFTLSALWQASKESTDREIRFGEKLDEMLLRLRQLQLGEEQTSTSGGNGQKTSSADVHDEEVMSILNDNFDEAGARIYAEMVRGLWNPKIIPTTPGQAEMGPASHEIQTAIIGSLVSGVFENIEDRADAIADSYEGTFNWVFNNEPLERDGRALWSSFPAWLESKTDAMYWITGKPGSGKSTLMKYILKSAELKVCLTKWAGGYPLQIANFYAWLAGSDMQKSHLGFMRTVLYQCLQADPELIKSVAPRRWSLLSTLRSTRKQPSWQDWEIKECFDVLLSKYDKSGSKRLAIFIDGLDEFKILPERTLDLIRSISDRGGIKICLASRQWTDFNDALDKYPMMRIQDLTEKDMIHFVRGSLEANRGFADLSKTFPWEAQSLVRETVEKSSGVFLWSALVIRRLLLSLSAGDGLPRLRMILEDLPDDLERLFTTLWESVEGDKSDSSALIALKKAAYPELNFFTLWIAHGGSEQPLDITALSDEAMSGVRGTMVRRLDSKTRGLLEISPKGNVEFLHRTAADWVAHNDVWSQISAHLPEDFDPCVSLLLAEARRFPESANDSWFQDNPQEMVENQMHRVLRYTFGVSNTPTEEVRKGIVEALDNMDKSVRDQAYSTLRSDWTYRSSNGFPCKFLGVIARYCFIPYLDAKFTSEPRAAQTASTLENAIFGHELTLPAAGVALESRQRTVAFLLDKGIGPKEFRDSRRGELRIRAEKAAARNEEEQREYWEGVERLLLDKEAQLERHVLPLDFTRKKDGATTAVDRDGEKKSKKTSRSSCLSCFG